MGAKLRRNAVNQTSQGTGQRPGLVTFAAIMMFLLGGFQTVWALTEFANAAWLASTAYGTFGGYLWLWGILDILFALVAFYAGYDLLRGGSFGQIFGLAIAGFSAIRWFFMLPVLPLAAVVIIAVDALILYSIISNAEYFSSRLAA
jgi:hypothetical protein